MKVTDRNRHWSNIPQISRSCNVDINTQYPAPFLHIKDLRYPRSDAFWTVWGLNRPDQENTATCHYGGHGRWGRRTGSLFDGLFRCYRLSPPRRDIVHNWTSRECFTTIPSLGTVLRVLIVSWQIVSNSPTLEHCDIDLNPFLRRRYEGPKSEIEPVESKMRNIHIHAIVKTVLFLKP